MILRGGAGINCDDGIEFSSVRLSLSHLSLSEIRTHGGRFFFSMKFTHQHGWLIQERFPQTSPDSGGPRHGNNPGSLLDFMWIASTGQSLETGFVLNFGF
jgi:hypothetical protein